MLRIEKTAERAAKAFNVGCGLSCKGNDIRPRVGLTHCMIIDLKLRKID